MIFKDLTNASQSFFEILPPDWQNEIVPFWETYQNHSKIYGMEQDEEIIGGGMVFYKSPPNFEYFEEEAKKWFSKNYHYLGFIWISGEKRNLNLGSYWLDQLKLLSPAQNYFLLTEEAHLHHFYTKNGFVCLKTINNEDHTEWLYSYEANS